MSKTEEPKKDVFQTLMELDLTPGRQRAPASAGSATYAETIREQITLESLMDVQEDLDYKRTKRHTERELEKLRLEEARAKALTAHTQGGQSPNQALNPAQEFIKGMSNPEFLVQWHTLTPEQQQNTLTMIQQMQAMTPAGAAGMNGMMPYWMMMQQRPQSEIGVKDLAEMFKAGVEAARQNSAPQTSPMEVFNAVQSVIKPFQDSANEATKQSFQAQIEAIKQASSKAGTLKDQLHEAKDIVEMFGGGGGASNYDLEMAKLTQQGNMQVMNMQMQLRQWEREADMESQRNDNLMQLASTAVAAIGPMVAEGVKNAVVGQVQQGHQPPQSAPPPVGVSDFRQMELDCQNCGHKWRYGFNIKNPPKEIECPSCKALLVIDYGTGK